MEHSENIQTEKDLISILVPVYNIHEYIGECIETLINQTYKNIDIILVDNGSDDGSYEICQEYAKKDSRIRLFRAGVRQQYIARNKTVEEIRGKYYCFVDGDDYVSVNYIKRMYDVITEYNVDMVVCGVTAMVECRNIKFDVTHRITLVNDPQKIRKCIWGKLYRTDLFKDVRFKDMRMGCDAVYSSEIYNISTNAAICGYNLYGYRSYISSVTHILLNKAFFTELDNCINDKNEQLFLNHIVKCLQIVSHRHEEQLFHRELLVLKEKVDIAKTNSINVSDELYQQLQTMIEKSQVGILKYAYLKLKYFYTSHMAAYRRRTNYHCKLD